MAVNSRLLVYQFLFRGTNAPRETLLSRTILLMIITISMTETMFTTRLLSMQRCYLKMSFPKIWRRNAQLKLMK